MEPVNPAAPPEAILLLNVRLEDRKNNASIAMVAGVSVRSLSGSPTVREPIKQTNRGRGEATSSRQT